VCCSRCFRFRLPRVGTLCPQAGALPLEFRRSAHRPQAAAPLTRTTRRSAMHHPTARATIPRFVCALFAISASPSTPTAGTPLRSLRAEHGEARRPSALEGPLTRVTQNLRTGTSFFCVPATLRERRHGAAPHRCSRSACSAVASTPIPPIPQFNRLSSPCAIAK